jgi:hypothetical protein
MAATVYAVRGSLYVGTITGATGSSGTLIKGHEDGEIEVAINVPEPVRVTNLDAQMNSLPSIGRKITANVILRLHAHDTTAAAMLLRWLQSGWRVNSNNAKPGAAETAQALIVRPTSTGEPYFYSPAVTLVRATGRSIFYSRSKPVFDGATVEFECGFSLAAPTEPAWVWDSSSAINTAYTGLS